ncbi:replication protein [Niabella aquatica]
MKNGYTKTPNILIDELLKELKYAELKILLVVIRQTYGWKKERDRISISQFEKKTGLSRRVISETIKILVEKNIITVSDTKGNILSLPKERQGRYCLFYSFNETCADYDINMCTLPHKHVQNMEHNKRNNNKRNGTKENSPEHINKIISELKSKWKGLKNSTE